jgi:hypothetical protein
MRSRNSDKYCQNRLEKKIPEYPFLSRIHFLLRLRYKIYDGASKKYVIEKIR